MKKLVVCSILLVNIITVMAQDPTIGEIQKESQKKSEKDTVSGWKKGGVIAVNIGQGSSHNWAAGAEKFSFSTAATVSLFANKTAGRFFWNNALDLGYAIVNTHSFGSRKTDDKIDFFSKMGRDVSSTFSLAGVFNFRSQFSKGYDYNYLGKGLKRKTSSFLAPAYLILAPGIDWHPAEYFSVFFSPLSLRWLKVGMARVLVQRNYLYRIYPPHLFYLKYPY